jgi:hypothetical protein
MPSPWLPILLVVGGIAAFVVGMLLYQRRETARIRVKDQE